MTHFVTIGAIITPEVHSNGKMHGIGSWAPFCSSARSAQHAVLAMAVTEVATAIAHPIRREAGVASAAPVDQTEVVVQGRDGRAPVRPSLTRLLRWRP